MSEMINPNKYICQLCVNSYTSRLIELENRNIEVSKFDAKELLFLLGETHNAENIKHMKLAKDEFCNNPSSNSCIQYGTIISHGINVIHPDYEYEDTAEGKTHFNSELRTVEDDINWMREICERNEGEDENE